MNDVEVIDAHFHLQKNLAEEKEILSVISRRDRDRCGNPESITDYSTFGFRKCEVIFSITY
jgi:hypothetical protein